jgi:UbiD family decarboxylase
MNFPEIADIALPAEGVFHNLVFVSIKKTYPMQAYKVLADGHQCTASGAWARPACAEASAGR